MRMYCIIRQHGKIRWSRVTSATQITDYLQRTAEAAANRPGVVAPGYFDIVLTSTPDSTAGDTDSRIGVK